MHHRPLNRYSATNRYVAVLDISFSDILPLFKTDLCSQTIFDLVYPNDLELIKQQLLNEKKTTSSNTGESSNDSKSAKKFSLI